MPDITVPPLWKTLSQVFYFIEFSPSVRLYHTELIIQYKIPLKKWIELRQFSGTPSTQYKLVIKFHQVEDKGERVKEESLQENQFLKLILRITHSWVPAIQQYATNDLGFKVQLNFRKEMDRGWRDLCGYSLLLVLLFAGAQLWFKMCWAGYI